MTAGEVKLARTVFGDAIRYDEVAVVNGKWAFFQSRRYIMTPTGSIHYHPKSGAYHDDFSQGRLEDAGIFIHELAHVWQWQQGVFLPLKRHPFCRYDYALKPGQKFGDYGLEQQAEIVRHAFLLLQGAEVVGAPGVEVYKGLLPFKAA